MSFPEYSEVLQIPKRIFIVPYRNRAQHKFFFCKYMSFLLENEDDYEIYFSHQCDSRSFNRGAAKNIGFLAIKEKYPDHYKNITLIFNDIDTMPFHKLFDYSALPGVVKHYYGFKYALGGIVAITGADFEKINGFPNFWGWGMEDAVLQKRCDRFQLKIDRSNFYTIGAHEILQLFDGVSRIISQKDPWRATNDNGVDGLKTINKLLYTIDSESANPQDNIFTTSVNGEGKPNNTFYINIASFMTGVRFESDDYTKYDLRDPPRKIINPNQIIRPAQMPQIQVDNWTNIPYYPDFAEKKEEEKIRLEQQSFVKQDISQQQLPKQQQSRVTAVLNKYSPEYAASINVNPRARKSANIGLGGVRSR